MRVRVKVRVRVRESVGAFRPPVPWLWLLTTARRHPLHACKLAIRRAVVHEDIHYVRVLHHMILEDDAKALDDVRVFADRALVASDGTGQGALERATDVEELRIAGEDAEEQKGRVVRAGTGQGLAGKRKGVCRAGTRSRTVQSNVEIKQAHGIYA